MKKILLFPAFLLSMLCSAQTKLISHRSHSGSDGNFRLAFENNLFDMGNSNLGAAPERWVKNARLDTVIFVSESKSIMVTSEVCNRLDWSDSQRIRERKVWKAGKDVVENHPLFTKKHSLDSIKSVLKTEYNFANDIDDVVFVGYDNKAEKQKRKKKGMAPFHVNQPKFPTGLLVALILFSLSMIAVYYFFQAFRNRNLSPE